MGLGLGLGLGKGLGLGFGSGLALAHLGMARREEQRAEVARVARAQLDAAPAQGEKSGRHWAITRSG